jgi:hypothetical protein
MLYMFCYICFYMNGEVRDYWWNDSSISWVFCALDFFLNTSIFFCRSVILTA